MRPVQDHYLLSQASRFQIDRSRFKQELSGKLGRPAVKTLIIISTDPVIQAGL